ncbi:hypothetical protein Plim_3521 [Planctopirus limnophila DSM 3776]|uniref:Uncharacterized protein n=1 Tax=Planctopirus limnophila (strain ATCC 43296 / DSM 3776 / IFAM 1008 / Mu 290) TaxID=521674 RepID=D5SV48_PLAL2|nr:hypothetical protein Plim_3521 [Planctopirus limnophila DSM 3776]
MDFSEQEICSSLMRHNSTHPTEPVDIDCQSPPCILVASFRNNHTLGEYTLLT